MNDIESLKSSVQSLSTQMTALQVAVSSLTNKVTNHKHGGADGTQKLPSTNQIDASQVNVYGGTFIDSASSGGLALAPLTVIGTSTKEPTTSRRQIGFTVGCTGVDTPSEFLQGISSVGVASPDKLDVLNKFDFSKANFAQTILANLTNDTSTPPSAFYFGLRSPVVNGKGSIVNAGATLTDETLSLSTTSQFTIVGCYINIIDSAGNFLETHTIGSFTNNTITLAAGETWASPTGNDYIYFVFSPVYLGSGDYPWKRIYTVSDIRFGIGPSSGSNIMFIKSGLGTPEAVISASTGSLYLDNTGKLYLKSSGTGNTGWVQVTAGGGGVPTPPNDATKFLNGAATPAFAQVKDSDLSTSNVSTNNVTIAKHGFVPILPNDATKFFDGTGAYSIPPASPSGSWSLFTTIASNNIRTSSAASTRSEYSTSYVKEREIVLDDSTGTIRVSFDIGVYPGGSGYGRIYKNGVAYGTERIVANGASPTTYTEDLTFTHGDLIQLYLKVSIAPNYTANNFLSIAYDKIVNAASNTVNL